MKTQLFFFLAIAFIGVFSCAKNDLPDDIYHEENLSQIEEWYNSQLIYTNSTKAFIQKNNPDWGGTVVRSNNELKAYTTSIYRDSILTRELHVQSSKGSYKGIIYEYIHVSNNLIIVNTYTINGRLTEFGVFNSAGKYTTLGIIENNITAPRAAEDWDLGTIPPVIINPPSTGGGSNPSEPTPPTYPPHTGGGGGNNSNNNNWIGEPSTLWPGDISCGSFKFGAVTNNRMATRLTNIKPVTFHEIGGMTKSFHIRNLIIDVPSRLANGTTISSTDAAKAIAESMNIAVKTLGMIYGRTGKYKNAMSAEYERDFIETVNQYFLINLPGTRVSVDNGTRPDVKSNSQATYQGWDGLFGDGGC